MVLQLRYKLLRLISQKTISGTLAGAEAPIRSFLVGQFLALLCAW